jgi:hypothetical protein
MHAANIGGVASQGVVAMTELHAVVVGSEYCPASFFIAS